MSSNFSGGKKSAKTALIMAVLLLQPVRCFATVLAENVCPANIICQRINDTGHAHNIDNGSIVMSSDGFVKNECSYFDQASVSDGDPDSQKNSAHVFYDATTKKFVGGADWIVCPSALP